MSVDPLTEGEMRGGNGSVKRPDKSVKVPQPEYDSDLDGNSGPKEKKHWLVTFLMLFALAFLSYGIGSIVQNRIDNSRMKPQIVEVKGEEVVKYVEKSKTPTKDFLTHLNPNVDPRMAEVIGESVDKYATQYKLPRKLICAIMKAESNVNPFARSSVDAIGLMQVLPKYHQKRISDRNLWHISVNVDVGCNILADYLKLEKGNLDKAFHRYLSKNASKVQLEKYTSKIYKYWSKLEMYDYLSTQERHLNKNGNGDEEESTPHSEQTESQPDEPVHQKK